MPVVFPTAVEFVALLRTYEHRSLRHRVNSSRVPPSSWILSVAFHGALAALLWCVVFRTIRPASIQLTATAATGRASPALKVGQSKLNVEAPWGSEPMAGAAEAVVEVPSNLDDWLDTRSKIDLADTQLGPNSIEFFGARAYGNRFVFVLDISYSMKARDGDRYRRACQELVRSVSQLRPDQEYYVLLFSWYTEEMFFQKEIDYVQATGQHVKRLEKWIGDVTLSAGTDPRRALSLAQQMNPDAVFLLSDGHFNQPSSPNSETGWFDSDGYRSQDRVLSGIQQRFSQTPIHTIAFENPFTVKSMREIAKVTRGQFRYIRTNSAEPADFEKIATVLRQLDILHLNQPSGKAEFESRMSYARELISSGELAAAEYVLRPVMMATDPLVDNRVLLAQLTGILRSELNGLRLEDFDLPDDLVARMSDP